MDSPTYKMPSIISGKNCSSPVVHEWSPRFVGAGIQLDLPGSLGCASGSIGFEVIVFWDVDECSESGAPIVQCYYYHGNSCNLDEAADLISNYQDVIDDIKTLANAIKASPVGTINDYISGIEFKNHLGVKVSGVLVYGENGFHSTKDYEHDFYSSSYATGCFGYTYSQGTNCHSHSFGFVFGSPSYGASYSYTYYTAI